MEGGTPGDDYYYIEDVTHTMYFDGEMSLHAAYWHDDFGRPKSHGCVNLAPRAAEWLFFWSEDAPNDLWVWSHYSTHADFNQS
jgi:lipoprotein-anchoring transpeptidase ErfK/SrfK